MRVPIPDDWDGETWICVQVQWPESELWLALLRGLLTMATRGRWWDEKSGSIAGAQAVGWEIWRRNFPFAGCGDHPPGEDNGGDLAEVAAGALLELLGEVDEMAVLDIKIEDGKLWKRMSPCCEWIEVGALPGTAPRFDSDPWEDTASPTYTKCGKATAIIDKLYAVGDTCWDQKDNLPWEWVRNVRQAHPDLVGGDSQLWGAVLAARAFSLIPEAGYDTIFDPSTRQELLCRIKEEMTEDGERLTEAQWDAIGGGRRLSGHLSKVWGYNLEAYAFWWAVIRGIGKNDMSDIAVAGATETGLDCDCPPEPLRDPRDSWPENDWAHWFDLTSPVLPGGISVIEGAHIPGVGVRAFGDQGDLSHPAIDLDFATETGQIQLVFLQYRLGSGLDYEGVRVLVGTDVASLAGHADTGDSDPSAGGVFTVQKIVSHQLTTSDDRLFAKVEARDESGNSTVERAVVIEAIGFAGMGSDPLA